MNPLFGTEMKFDIRWLKFWLVRPKRLNVYIMADPSKGKQATSDNTAMVVVGVDVARNKYLLDGFRHRMPLSRRWQVLRSLYRRWSRMPGIETVNVGYEQYGLQTDLEYFDEQMQRDEVSFSIAELAWTTEGRISKEQRIERLEPDFRMGRMRLPHVIDIDDEGQVIPVNPLAKKAAKEAIARNERWRVAAPIQKKDEDSRVYDVIAGLIEEFTFFPFGPTNDFLDALSRIYDMDISPPLAYEESGGANMALEPEVFFDT